MKKALILGIGGQDGSYLAQILLEAGWYVHGLVRRSSVDNLWRIRPITEVYRNKLVLHYGDITDVASLQRIFLDVDPEWIFNVADQDNVDASYHSPLTSVQVTYGGAANVLECVKTLCPQAKLYQPVTGLMFSTTETPQNEDSPLCPRSPYAVAKAGVFMLCQHYRREYGLNVLCCILYNHDSVRRSGDYVLQKICKQAVEVSLGKRDKILLGNPDALIDLGDAESYMRCVAYLMINSQGNHPRGDFVVSPGVPKYLRLICQSTLHKAGVSRIQDSIGVDPAFSRPGGLTQSINNYHLGNIEKLKKVVPPEFLPKSLYQSTLIEDLVDKYKKELGAK